MKPIQVIYLNLIIGCGRGELAPTLPAPVWLIAYGEHAAILSQ